MDTNYWKYPFGTPPAGQQTVTQPVATQPAPQATINGMDFNNMGSNTEPYYINAGNYVNSDYHNALAQQPGFMDQAAAFLQQGNPAPIQNDREGIEATYGQSQAQIPGYINQAVQGVNSGYQQANRDLSGLYQNRLKPLMQNAINSMASRNMVNSSVGADAYANAMGQANQQILEQQANLSGQRAGALGQLYGLGLNQQAGLSSNRARDIASNYGDTQNNNAKSSLLNQATYGNLAGQGLNALNSASLQHSGQIGQLATGLAGNQTQSDMSQWNLAAQLLPTIIAFGNSGYGG